MPPVFFVQSVAHGDAECADRNRLILTPKGGLVVGASAPRVSPWHAPPWSPEDPDSCSRSRSSLGGMILGSRLFALKTTRDTAARRAIVN